MIERALSVVPGRRPVDQAEGSFVATDESHVLGNRHAIDQTVILVNEREMIVPMMVDIDTSEAALRTADPRFTAAKTAMYTPSIFEKFIPFVTQLYPFTTAP